MESSAWRVSMTGMRRLMRSASWGSRRGTSENCSPAWRPPGLWGRGGRGPGPWLLGCFPQGGGWDKRLLGLEGGAGEDGADDVERDADGSDIGDEVGRECGVGIFTARPEALAGVGVCGLFETKGELTGLWGGGGDADYRLLPLAESAAEDLQIA